MAKPKMLCGVVPATVTPFGADGGVDAGALLRLIRWNMGQGAESFFIGGSSAECFLLAHEERIQVFEAAAELRDEAFLTAHVGAIATREAADYARRAAALGYDAIAATPPFYYGFGSREVYAYYADIAQAAGMPVLIYNFPGNTNRPFDLTDPVTRRLFKSDFILGVKHTNQVVYQLERIKALNPALTVMHVQLHVPALPAHIPAVHGKSGRGGPGNADQGQRHHGRALRGRADSRHQVRSGGDGRARG